MTDSTESRSWRAHLLVLLLFVVVTLAFTWPLPARLNTHFAGDNIDVWINMWVNWWTRKAIDEGLPLYETDYLLYPHGAPLYFHSFSHTNTVLWLFLAPWTAALTAYNVTILLGFVGLACGISLLARELTGSGAAGVVAGLAAAFAPYHVWESAHPTLFSTQYIPLLVWALVTLFRRPAWWRGLLVGIFAGLTAFTGWHQPLYAAVIAGPYLVWALLLRRPRPDGQVWWGLLVAVLVGGLLVGPALVPLVREQIGGGYASADPDWVFNTDVLAWLTPSFLHPLWGDAVRPAYERFAAPNRPAFVGFVVLALALVGMIRSAKRHPWLVAATLLALVLALGTRLQVGGRVLLPHLPWYDPLIGFVRAPVRLNLVLGQCLALLAAFGVAGLLGGRAGWRRPALATVVAAGVLFEFVVWPFPTTEVTAPAFYVELAQEPEDFALVEAPRDRQSDKFYMYWQTIHGKPLVNGHISRAPATAFDFIEGNAITRAFAHRERLRGRDGLGAARDGLAGVGVRAIVVHRDLLAPGLATDWTAALATRPTYEDDRLTVFAARPEAGIDFPVWHDFGGPLLSQAWFETGEPLRLVSHWSAPAGAEVEVALRSEDGVAFDGGTLSVAPATFSTARGELETDGLPPGAYEGVLTVDGDAFALPARLVVTAQGTFAARVQPDAVWDEAIALRGVDWHRLANSLLVDLQWEAVRPPAADYKLFVHLRDEEGTLVAQQDGVPCDWGCPTSTWAAGDSVSDRMVLSLRGVPAGTYRLAIGWYVPGTPEPVPGVDGAGQPLPEGGLVLGPRVRIP